MGLRKGRVGEWRRFVPLFYALFLKNRNSNKQVGVTKNYLLYAGLSGNGTVCTKRAIIKQSTFISSESGGKFKEYLDEVRKRLEKLSDDVFRGGGYASPFCAYNGRFSDWGDKRSDSLG